jgi:hypothetical protein
MNKLCLYLHNLLIVARLETEPNWNSTNTPLAEFQQQAVRIDLEWRQIAHTKETVREIYLSYYMVPHGPSPAGEFDQEKYR